MNRESGLRIRPAVLVVLAVFLVAAGAAAMYVAMARVQSSARPADTRASSAAPQATASAPVNSDVVTVTLSPDALTRAGIEVQPVSLSTFGGRLRLPGTVQPNAYRTVVVTSLVGGRVARVSAELGDSVRRGQPLAEVYSPELSEAQTRFVAAQAELDAHERELRRTEKLADIGSASRQELERIHAEHTAALTMVQSLRSRLTLLGITDAQMAKLMSGTSVTATVVIPSPIDGVVTVRDANAGLNVDPSAPLFTVADLSSVWIVGDLNERDLSRVRVGSPAVITTTALPELRREGKVSYIDPQIKAATRTAPVRVEIANPGGQLRLGMYVDMEVGEAASTRSVTVPRSAVQLIGDRSVVYVAHVAHAGQFVERAVQTGPVEGDAIQIINGLNDGERIAVSGSFAIRAEADRSGSRTSAAAAPQNVGGQAVRITVSEKGFDPARITVRAGAPVRLTFVRTTDATCATEVKIPSLKITRELPLNQPVEIDLAFEKTGEVAFACGMDMFNGAVVVQ